MADNTVGWLHVTHLGWTVVAFSAVGVAEARVEGGGQVALLTDIGEVGIGLDGGGGRGHHTNAFSVTGKTLGTHTGVMIRGQGTLTRITEGMTERTLGGCHRSPMTMALNAISVSRAIMEII